MKVNQKVSGRSQNRTLYFKLLDQITEKVIVTFLSVWFLRAIEICYYNFIVAFFFSRSILEKAFLPPELLHLSGNWNQDKVRNSHSMLKVLFYFLQVECEFGSNLEGRFEYFWLCTNDYTQIILFTFHSLVSWTLLFHNPNNEINLCFAFSCI